MARTKKPQNQSGGVNISGSTVHVKGDVVGHNKITKHLSGSAARKNSDPQHQSSRPIKILFLAANPQDTDQLRLGEEIRGIKQALLQAEYRDKFAIEQEWAVRVSDLQGHLLRHQPDIVHFSGHGSEASEIILQDDTGESQAVPTRALERLFATLKDNIRCVVLNACYSKKQAQAIAKHIDCVIGMSTRISDPAGRNFAIAFYRALGFGKNVQTAFDLGCVQIDMQSLNEQDTPRLLAINKNPKEIIFAQSDIAEASDKPSDNLKIVQTVTGNQNIFSGTGNVTITNQPKD